MKQKKKVYFWLFLIILLGIGLRFYNLSAESLWTDEMVSLMHTQRSNDLEIIDSVTNMELMPPGYFLILDRWINYFGNSEFSLRFLSVLFDSLSILLVFLIATKLFNKKIGLISAFLLATTMLQIVYAQEARPYSLFGFLVLLSTYLLILAFDNKIKYKKTLLFVLYSIFVTLSLYVNYMALFLIILHLMFLIFFKKNKEIKNFIKSIIFTLIIFIPGFSILKIQALLRHTNLQKNLVLRGVPQFLSDFGVGFYLLPLITLTFFLILAYLYLRRNVDWAKFNKKMIFFSIISLFLFMVVHIVLLDTFMRSFALIRHSFFIVPFIYIGIAILISKFDMKKAKLILIVILLFNSFTLFTYYTETTKAPWDKGINFVDKNSLETDTLILLDRSGSNFGLLQYHSLNKDFRIMNLTWGEKRKLVKINESELFVKLNKEESFWLISSRNIKTGTYYKDLLAKKYELIESKKYKEMEVYHFSSINKKGQCSFN